MPRDIQIVGHVCVDLTPGIHGQMISTPGTLTEVGPMGISIGGPVGNGLRAARALGSSVAVAATVGSDELGSLCREVLEAGGPASDVVLAASHANATSYSIVLEPPGVDRSFWHHTGANDEFDGSCELVGASFVHYGYPMLTPAMTNDLGQPTVELFQRARRQGSATSLDLAYSASNSSLSGYPWDKYFGRVLPETDVFCPSWDDITSARAQPDVFDPRQVEKAAEEFLEMGAGLVLMTAGESGSYLATGVAERVARVADVSRTDPKMSANIREWIPAPPIARFVSTNGAGDTFKVAFLLRVLAAPDVAEAARQASSIVAQHISNLPLVRGEA